MATAFEWGRRGAASVACLLACCCWCTAAVAGKFDSSHRETASDPVRDYLPGKYYERIALDAMRRKDYAGAVSAYTNAAYWADTVAEYNLGEIYFHGMGSIPADPARGVAWFGIAAEEHKPDYDAALVAAYKTLSPEERQRADGIWKTLQAVYGGKLTLARATRAFEHDYHAQRAGSATTEDDPNTYTFSIGGYDPAGNIQNEATLISDLNALGIRNAAPPLTGIWVSRKQEFAEFIATQFGQVHVGRIEQVAPVEKKPAH